MVRLYYGIIKQMKNDDSVREHKYYIISSPGEKRSIAKLAKISAPKFDATKLPNSSRKQAHKIRYWG